MWCGGWSGPDSIADNGRAFVEGFLPAFRDTDFAYGLAGLMALAAILIAVIAVLRHLAAVTALQGRRHVVGFISFEKTNEAAGGADAQETQFARRFQEIDGAMKRPGLIAGAIAIRLSSARCSQSVRRSDRTHSSPERFRNRHGWDLPTTSAWASACC